MGVKNCIMSEILPYLQANKLVCYCFTDAVKGHKTPGSETKNNIIHCKSSNQSLFWFVLDRSPVD